MRFEPVPGAKGVCLVTGNTATPVLRDTQSALELLVNARYECGCSKYILDKALVSEAFFDLKNGLAGSILQKFANYRGTLAIVGDFSGYTSQSLHDFIRESNRGQVVFFVPSTRQAIEKLQQS